MPTDKEKKLADAFDEADGLERMVGKGANAKFGVAEGKDGALFIEITFPKEVNLNRGKNADGSNRDLGDELNDIVTEKGKNEKANLKIGIDSTKNSLVIPIERMKDEAVKKAIWNHKDELQAAIPKTADFLKQQVREAEESRKATEEARSQKEVVKAAKALRDSL